MLENYIIQQHGNKLKWLGIYQIIGGALGLVLTIIAVFPFNNLFNTILFIPCCLLFGLSIYTGWQTYKLTYLGLQLTFINQLLQLFSLTVGKFGFHFVAGIGLRFTLDFTNSLNLGFALGLSDIDITINRGPNEYFIGINLIALILIYLTDKIMAEIKRNNELSKAGQHKA